MQDKQKIVKVLVSIHILWKQNFLGAAMLGLKQEDDLVRLSGLNT